MRMMPLVDVTRATMSRSSNGSVVFDDPGSPWLVRIWTRARTRGHPAISRLHVTARSGDATITPGQLARLPLNQMLHLASTESAVVRAHPNEAHYRRLVDQKQPGGGWGDEHWDNVLDVFNWARKSKRQGGGWRAIAEFWSVTERPTAKRWMIEARKARKRAGAGSSSQP